jgi:peptide-methionine (S)-S-oxide reductase
MSDENLAKATLATGCFWCTEAIFERLEGVHEVVSGYTGGQVENPSYEQVCQKNTGHAEAVEITYEPGKISFEELLDVFWQSHDPTTLNRQGADVGPQYRSAIFYHNEEQRKVAEASKAKWQAQFSDPIVTEITPASTFYPAEDYHQDYHRRYPEGGYCNFVISPKLKKLEEKGVL